MPQPQPITSTCVMQTFPFYYLLAMIQHQKRPFDLKVMLCYMLYAMPLTAKCLSETHRLNSVLGNFFLKNKKTKNLFFTTPNLVQ